MELLKITALTDGAKCIHGFLDRCVARLFTKKEGSRETCVVYAAFTYYSITSKKAPIVWQFLWSSKNRLKTVRKALKGGQTDRKGVVEVKD